MLWSPKNNNNDLKEFIEGEYEYRIAIENFESPDYFSEKLIEN